MQGEMVHCLCVCARASRHMHMCVFLSVCLPKGLPVSVCLPACLPAPELAAELDSRRRDLTSRLAEVEVQGKALAEWEGELAAQTSALEGAEDELRRRQVRGQARGQAGRPGDREREGQAGGRQARGRREGRGQAGQEEEGGREGRRGREERRGEEGREGREQDM